MGGHFVITGSMSLGDFTAFNSYLTILIFPIIIIGFTSNVIAQASASYGRVSEILDTPKKKDIGTLKKTLEGSIEVHGISLKLREKYALRDVSFTIKPKTRTAIMWPTAAGKTQLLYVLTGLLETSTGEVKYDGINIGEYDKQSFHEQVGIVFQDSSLFNLTLRENIAFSNTIRDEDIKKAFDGHRLSIMPLAKSKKSPEEFN